jgi:hypothetical protein
MFAVARNQTITCKTKKRRNKKYAEVHLSDPGKALGSARPASTPRVLVMEGKHAL